MRWAFCAMQVTLLLLTDPVPAAAQEEFEARLTITALATDDGLGTPLRSPTAAFFDTRARELIVCEGGRGRIVVFDESLMPKYAFPHFVRVDSARPRTIGEPRSAVTLSNGNFVVVDNLSSSLHVLDFRGNPQETMPLGPLLGDAKLKIKPEALDIDLQDNLYILVSGDMHTVLKLNRDFQLIRTIGAKGADSSELNTIVSMAEQDGFLVLADLYGTPAIKVFDTAGTFVTGFGGHDVEKADFSMPAGLCIMTDPQDGTPLIFVADALRQVVKVLTRKGGYVGYFGGFGGQLGEFRYPSSVVTTGLGLIFVVEKGGNRIQAFQLH